MALRFSPLIATLLLLVCDAVALDVDRPHHEVHAPVVLNAAKNDEGGEEKTDGDEEKAEGDEEKAEGDEEKAEGDEEKKEGDEEKKEGDEEKAEEKKEGDEEKDEKEDEKEDEKKEDEKKEDEKEPSTDVLLPPGTAAFFGPGGCVATFRSTKGTCVMQTRCAKQDAADYEYGLTCVDDAGVSTRHEFGAGSFAAEETFDTLIQCKLCLGADVSKTRTGELSDAVSTLENEMEAIKDDVKLIKEHLDLDKEEKKDEEKKEDSEEEAAEEEATADEAAEEGSSEESSEEAATEQGFLHAKAVHLVSHAEEPAEHKNIQPTPRRHVHRPRPGLPNHAVAKVSSHRRYH